jgi:outer membrane lipoprotein-sorting protein
MRRVRFTMLLVAFAAITSHPARAQNSDATAVVDKAIVAVGGEENLRKTAAMTWKSKGKVTFGGNEFEFEGQITVEGLDHYRAEFEGESNGAPFRSVVVLNGKRGWRKLGENRSEMNDSAIARERRNIYLQIIPVTLLPLKTADFKLETVADEKVGDKPAAVIKVVGPDGKDFTIYFDKESGMPVKLVARVTGFGGDEYSQETTFSNYKEFAGIKKATNFQSKRDGVRFDDVDLIEFRTLDKVDPESFTEPK